MKQRWMGLLLVVAAGCSFDFSRRNVYGTALDPALEGRLVCWPTDEQGRPFRCVVDRNGPSIDDQHVYRIEENGLRTPPIARIGSVIVVLPLQPSEEVQRRTNRLMQRLENKYPVASYHTVSADQPWTRIRTSARVRKALEGVSHDERRREQSAFVDALLRLAVLTSTPNYVVVPLAGKQGRFAVIGDLRQRRHSVREMTGEEVSKLPRSLGRPSWLARTFGIRDRPPPWPRFHLAVPMDAPGPVRRQCVELARTLADRGGVDAVVHPASARYATVADRTSVRDLLERDPRQLLPGEYVFLQVRYGYLPSPPEAPK